MSTIREPLAAATGAFLRGHPPFDRLSDDWLAHFGIEGIERHDPVADAWATAELFLIALAAADRQGMKTAEQLPAVQKAHRWLGKRG
jgi:hypothetical protein